MKIGETGVTFRANANFDMSSYTELSIVFIKPNGTKITKTTADGVSLGTTTVTQDVDGVDTTFTANKYAEYETEDIFDTAGKWRAYVIYENSALTDKFIGDTDNFTVYDPTLLN